MSPLLFAYTAMIGAVAASNYLVQFPINDWLTWGVFPYPFTFFVTELTNCYYGPKNAKKVAFVGFLLAVALSIWLATFKIALASGSAFLISQLFDIFAFNKLRQAAWWVAPFIASIAASIVDSSVFWSLAFMGEDVPLITWAIGDTLVKIGVDFVLLMPYRMIMRRSLLPYQTNIASQGFKI